MTYKNDKLNIIIENSEYFEIKEKNNWVELWAEGKNKFVVFGNSTVEAYDNSTVNAFDNSKVNACVNSKVNANNNSTVKAYDNSTVKAYDNSTVNAYDNSTVKAYDNSTVYAYYNSTVEAYEFSCIHRLSIGVNIETKNHFGAITGQVFTLDRNITVYKKLREGKIAVLELEKGQVFQSACHDKCRTNRVKVLRIESPDGNTQYESGKSLRDDTFIYEAGKVVSTKYDKQIDECSNGIHFFLVREKAEKYIG